MTLVDDVSDRAPPHVIYRREYNKSVTTPSSYSYSLGVTPRAQPSVIEGRYIVEMIFVLYIHTMLLVNNAS
jgi:hypothetical protein